MNFDSNILAHIVLHNLPESDSKVGQMIKNIRSVVLGRFSKSDVTGLIGCGVVAH